MDISRFNKDEDEVLIAPGIFNVIKRYEKDLVTKIPSFTYDGPVMRATYTEKIVPTVYYELLYTDYDGNSENSENSKDEEKKSEYNFGYKKSKRKSRKSIKRKSRKSIKRKSHKSIKRKPRKSIKRKSRKSIKQKSRKS